MNKYIIIPQKPYLCAMACLSMIIYKQTGILKDQEEMAEFFQIKIHPRYQACYNIELPHTENINSDEGMNTIDEEEKFNQYFQSENINLIAKAYKYNKIENLKTFISENLKAGNSLQVEYKCSGIWKNYTGIHDGIIESIHGNNSTIINPAPESKSRFECSLENLSLALGDQIARETGIMVISKK